MVGIEEWYMHREKEASVILDNLWLIRWRDQLFDGERMDGKILLKIGDIFIVRILKINPGDLVKLHLMHRKTFVFSSHSLAS